MKKGLYDEKGKTKAIVMSTLLLSFILISVCVIPAGILMLLAKLLFGS